MKAYLDKVDPLGTLFAAFCCVGTPGVIVFLSAIGAGFLINDAILLPLLIIFLAASIAGLYFSFKSHENRWPLILSGASAFIILFFTYGMFIRPMVYWGLLGLVGVSIWNVIIKRRHRISTA